MSFFIESGASFSEDRKYRYTLWRTWGEGKPLVAICLNPSSADEVDDDPTVTRMIRRAHAWGYPGFTMLNLFAWRSTDPGILKTLHDPVGPDNDRQIIEHCGTAGMVICGWGNASPVVEQRAREVKKMLREYEIDLHYLKMGVHQPWHPLYISYTATPIEWRG